MVDVFRSQTKMTKNIHTSHTSGAFFGFFRQNQRMIKKGNIIIMFMHANTQI